jgi:hypothetical protein
VLMIVTPRIPQDQKYHQFADRRNFIGEWDSELSLSVCLPACLPPAPYSSSSSSRKMRLLRGSLGFWQGNVLNADLQQGSGFGGKGKGLHVERSSSGTCFDMKFWSFENSADPGIESCTHTHMHTHTNRQRVEDGSGSLFVGYFCNLHTENKTLDCRYGSRL